MPERFKDDALEILHANEQKLELLIEKVEALTQMVARHEEVIYGENGMLGVAHKTTIMWRLGLVAFGLGSTLAGSVITLLIQNWLRK